MEKENIPNFQSPGCNFDLHTPCKNSSNQNSKRTSTVQIQSNKSQNSNDYDRIAKKKYFIAMQTPFPKSPLTFSDSENSSIHNSFQPIPRHQNFSSIIKQEFANENISPISNNNCSLEGSFFKSNNNSNVPSNLTSDIKWSGQKS